MIDKLAKSLSENFDVLHSVPQSSIKDVIKKHFKDGRDIVDLLVEFSVNVDLKYDKSTDCIKITVSKDGHTVEHFQPVVTLKTSYNDMLSTVIADCIEFLNEEKNM